MSYRDKGKAALSTVLKQEQNISTIEKYVFTISAADAGQDDTLEGVYKRNIYQTVGDILDGEKLKAMLGKIKAGKLGWEHPKFSEMKIRMEEQDNFLENPFEVVEGVQQCKAFSEKTGKICNSKRVMYFSRQERGADEPMTTYNTCCACGAKWKYSG